MSTTTFAVHIHRMPALIPMNHKFNVFIRIPGGTWQEIIPAAVRVNMNDVRNASLVAFDFLGSVDIRIEVANVEQVEQVRVRPLSREIVPAVEGNEIRFTLHKPAKLSIEINGDILENLHLFACKMEEDVPTPSEDVLFFGPGVHELPNQEIYLDSGKTLYLAGGAVLRGTIKCYDAENVVIRGRGCIDLQPWTPKDPTRNDREEQPKYSYRGLEIVRSRNIQIEGIMVLDSCHYCVYLGQSSKVSISNVKLFDCTRWGDGIDCMSCSDIEVEDAFIRTSDDCIAIYGQRWDYRGNVSNITVRNSILWADVAHAINIGLHGNSPEGNTLENLTFQYIDILEHKELTPQYQGCMAISCGDGNTVRDVLFEDIRVDDFSLGQLLNVRTVYNSYYNPTPGLSVERITFRNISYSGKNQLASVIEGWSAESIVKDIVFDHVIINGERILSPEQGNFVVGANVVGLRFK